MRATLVARVHGIAIASYSTTMHSQAKHSRSHSPDRTTDSTECIFGTVQSVDLVAQEIAVKLTSETIRFDIPPGCPIFLRSERVKLRMLQPHDEVTIVFGKQGGGLAAQRVEVQPNHRFLRLLL